MKTMTRIVLGDDVYLHGRCHVRPGLIQVTVQSLRDVHEACQTEIVGTPAQMERLGRELIAVAEDMKTAAVSGN